MRFEWDRDKAAANFDILHVAAALALGATRFVTNDRRQASLARAARLNATLLSPRRRG